MGKVRRGWIQDGIDLYLKRLPGFRITELRDSTPEKEAEAIQDALRDDETLVALMEQGDTLSSRGNSPSGWSSSAMNASPS